MVHNVRTSAHRRTRLIILAVLFSASAVMGVAPVATAAAQDPDANVQIIDGGHATYAPWAAGMFHNGQQWFSATRNYLIGGRLRVPGG